MESDHHWRYWRNFDSVNRSATVSYRLISKQMKYTRAGEVYVQIYLGFQRLLQRLPHADEIRPLRGSKSSQTLFHGLAEGLWIEESTS